MFFYLKSQPQENASSCTKTREKAPLMTQIAWSTPCLWSMVDIWPVGGQICSTFASKIWWYQTLSQQRPVNSSPYSSQMNCALWSEQFCSISKAPSQGNKGRMQGYNDNKSLALAHVHAHKQAHKHTHTHTRWMALGLYYKVTVIRMSSPVTGPQPWHAEHTHTHTLTHPHIY